MASMFSANVLLFLDKFNYLDMNGGEYRFEAKIVDNNTMQTISYLLIYTGKKLKPPVETLEKINFRNIFLSDLFYFADSVGADMSTGTDLPS